MTLPKTSTPAIYNDVERRRDLAAAYRIFARLGMDDMTYTHLSIRGEDQNTFFIYPFGLLFEEVTASSLLHVTLDGTVLSGTEDQYNTTGYVIHGGLYKSRPDVQAIFHLHTLASVAVSATRCGLLPVSQFSFHFYNRLAYYDYDSLALDADRQGHDLAQALGPEKKVLLMHNHGMLCAGHTIQEAFFYTYYLEQACKTQCMAGHDIQRLVVPDNVICEQAAQDMRAFEPDLGRRDWNALIRQLDRNDRTYQN